ncbi:MAG: hypothetical protein II868_06375 [Butyrivibrio sp.]|nr:hypothetical protein [Butyrivibrio sp.]
MAAGPHELSPRERRRRKRRRQQFTYTLITILLIAALAAGVFFGVRYAYGRFFAPAPAADEGISVPQVVEAPGASAGEGESVALSPEEQLNGEIAAKISEMTLEDKAAALFFVTPDQLTGMENITQAGETTQAALRSYPVAGIVYEPGNLTDRSQISDMLSATKKMSRYPLFLAVEEPGGEAGSAVAKALGATEALSPAEIAASNNTSAAQEAGNLIGAYLAQAGFNMNITPCANIAQDASSAGAYGDNMQMVSGMSVAMIKGLHGQSILTCTGRFPAPCAEDPGGREGVTATQRSMGELETDEFVPFRDCITAGTDIVMLSNISAPRAIGGNTPCTFSETLIHDELRSTLGYSGVVMTAPLDQEAITSGYTADHAAVAAIAAGADLLYRPENFLLAHKGIVDAVENGVLTEERIDQSLKRIFRLKYLSLK